MCSPSYRQADAPMINIHPTLRTTPDLCKNVSLAVLFGSNGNSHTVSTHAYIYIYLCVCVCLCSSQYRDAGLVKKLKILGQR